jgi:hypothetical protein
MAVVITDSKRVGKVGGAAVHSELFAPGWPGLPARWTSSAKSGIGTSVSRDSRVWFTLSHGILNEIYYPRIDHACSLDEKERQDWAFAHRPLDRSRVSLVERKYRSLIASRTRA